MCTAGITVWAAIIHIVILGVLLAASDKDARRGTFSFEKEYRLFIDFARAPEHCKSTNKHAVAIFVGAPAHCPIPKKVKPVYSAEFQLRSWCRPRRSCSVAIVTTVCFIATATWFVTVLSQTKGCQTRIEKMCKIFVINFNFAACYYVLA